MLLLIQQTREGGSETGDLVGADTTRREHTHHSFHILSFFWGGWLWCWWEKEVVAKEMVLLGLFLLLGGMS